MGKGKNHNNNNNNRQRRNYFTQEIERNGENFLAKKTPQDISRDADRIFRDLVRGNVDIMANKQYITNPAFLDQLIKIASINLNTWWGYSVACTEAADKYNGKMDEMSYKIIVGNRNVANNKFYIYQQIYNRLSAIRMNPINISLLISLPNDLRSVNQFI